VADGQLVDWWRAGDAIMPVMLAVAGVLYLRIGERAWALWSTGGRTRANAILAGLDAPIHPERTAWAAHYAGIAAEAELTRGLGLIRVLTTLLPLLGLLGTVAGMVASFGALAAPAAGAADATARSASAGIGQALTATQYGLALAIPAVVAELILRRRAATLAREAGLALSAHRGQVAP
jgi:biopolymer transport protein ExbB/TolQ